MTTRPMPPIRIALLALMLWAAPAAQAGEDASYPIWWSPELELESLNEIDERKERKFWAGSGGIPVVKNFQPDAIEEFIDSCSSYDHLSSEGYFARNNLNAKVLWLHTSICHALDALASAKPSRSSYVNRFKFDQNAIDYLPAMVSYPGSYDFACRQYVANNRRISWGDFSVSKFQEIEIVHDNEMNVLTETEHMTLQIFARADFNDNGQEDLMLRIHANAVGGSWGSTDIILITRDSPSGVFWVIDAEKSLNPNYTCQDSYNYPDALRESN